jgi:hypothetical protein
MQGIERIERSPTQFAIEETEGNHRSLLREVAVTAQMSREWVRSIRHQSHDHAYGSIVVPRLTPEAMQARGAFAQLQVGNDDGLPIIFTDESMMVQDLNLGGIWKKRGEIRHEGFDESDHQPISVMVWGAIGMGFGGPLVRCTRPVNQDTYGVIFGDKEFWRQQDSAPRIS